MELVDIGFNFTSNAFRDDEADVIQRAHQFKVNRFILTGSDVADSLAALKLTKRYSRMHSTAGVHPHLAKNWTQDTLQELKKIANEENVVAIGEAGLDYNRNYSTPEEQKYAYQAQLELAADLKMPIFLHERDAHDDFTKMLAMNNEDIPNVVVHCFTGTEEELEKYLELDCYIGITGWICDERRGTHLHSLINRIPGNRLMVESDAPYLLPRDLPRNSNYPKPKGRRNEPAYLLHIIETIARCRGESVEQIARQTTQNAKEFFSIT